MKSDRREYLVFAAARVTARSCSEFPTLLLDTSNPRLAHLKVRRNFPSASPPVARCEHRAAVIKNPAGHSWGWASRAARSFSVPLSTTSHSTRRNSCSARSSRPHSSSTCNPCRRMCHSGSNRSNHTHRNRPVTQSRSRQLPGRGPSRPTE